LPNGKEIDFTRDQFSDVTVCCDEIKSREYVLESNPARSARTKERYRILKQRVEDLLHKLI